MILELAHYYRLGHASINPENVKNEKKRISSFHSWSILTAMNFFSSLVFLSKRRNFFIFFPSEDYRRGRANHQLLKSYITYNVSAPPASSSLDWWFFKIIPFLSLSFVSSYSLEYRLIRRKKFEWLRRIVARDKIFDFTARSHKLIYFSSSRDIGRTFVAQPQVSRLRTLQFFHFAAIYNLLVVNYCSSVRVLVDNSIRQTTGALTYLGLVFCFLRIQRGSHSRLPSARILSQSKCVTFLLIPPSGYSGPDTRIFSFRYW